MSVQINIINGNQEGVELEVVQNGIDLKKLFKQYQSLFSLYNLIKLWYSDRKIIKPVEPVGLFSPSVSDCILSNQEFLNRVLKELGTDCFPVKSFLRLYNLSNKVVIITGASSGIGKANAYQLAEMGACLILACRSESKTRPVIEDIKKKTGNENIEFMKLDLLDLDSVRAFVAAFKEKNLPIHILINNAGSVALEGKTPYGIDKTFGVNHVGPVVLTMGLLDIITSTENSRIIFVSSSLAEKTKKLPFDKIRAGIPLNFLYPVEAYGYSKLANVLFTKLLAKKLSDSGKSTKVFVLHPGDVATDIYRSMPNSVASIVKKFLLQEEEGSFMTLYLAVDPGCEHSSGNYFAYPKGFTPLSVPLFEDVELQRLCWEETAKMSGAEF